MDERAMALFLLPVAVLLIGAPFALFARVVLEMARRLFQPHASTVRDGLAHGTVGIRPPAERPSTEG
jgi:hypothetical protein